MFNPKIDSRNIIAVSEEDLKEDQKQDLSLPRQVTFDSNPGKLQEMVNSAVNHALINHSNVLSNTVHNVVV
jgi:hypothetical protein